MNLTKLFEELGPGGVPASIHDVSSGLIKEAGSGKESKAIRLTLETPIGRIPYILDLENTGILQAALSAALFDCRNEKGAVRTTAMKLKVKEVWLGRNAKSGEPLIYATLEHATQKLTVPIALEMADADILSSTIKEAVRDQVRGN